MRFEMPNKGITVISSYIRCTEGAYIKKIVIWWMFKHISWGSAEEPRNRRKPSLGPWAGQDKS